MKTIYFFLVLLCSQSLFAQTKTWVGGTSTDWHTPANWNPASVPTATDAVVFNANTTYDPVINANAVAKSVDITTGAIMLTINAGDTLTLSNVGNPINMTDGYVMNNGTINATNTRATQPGNEGALRMTGGQIYQYGTMILNGGNTYGISSTGAAPIQITCYSGSTTTISATDAFRFTNSATLVDIRSGATVTATGTTRGGFLNPGKIQCAGNLTITGQVEHYNSTGQFTTSSCGRIIINGNLNLDASATVTNAGYINVSGNLAVPTSGNFTNNGVLKYGTKSGHANGINNRRALVFDTSSPTGIFTISTTAGSTTINGIYSDAAATVSAGTYNSPTNTFSILPTYSAGTYTFYAKLTQSICEYIVPFSYTRASTRWYIKPTASGTGDGRTWADAASDLQATINAALPGDSIFIAAGVYKPQKDASGNASPTNSRNKVFFTRTGVSLFGGFAGTETSVNQRNIANNRTIFSGDIDNNDTDANGNNIADSPSDIQGNNAYHILIINNCDKYTKIDGIVFTAAKNVTTTSGAPSQSVNGIPTFAYSGAVPSSSSTPSFNNCVFSGNSGFFGTLNHANTNASDTLKINNTYFINNFAKYGGGIFFSKGSTELSNIVMANNTSDYGGAFMVSQNYESDRTIRIRNASIINNTSVYQKAIYIEGGIIKLINTILWNTTPITGGNLSLTAGTLESSYSILQGAFNNTTWLGNYGTNSGNNYDLNPFLNDVADIDGADNKFFTSDDGLVPSTCSPALNTGISTTSTDLVGNPRPYLSGITDIGAYEVQANSTRPDNATSVNASSTSITCGTSVTLTGTCATGTLTWYDSFGGTTALGTGTNFSHTPTTTTTYYASCEVSATCISLVRTATATVTVTLPAAPLNVNTSSTSICPNTSITLTATCPVGTVVEWYNGASVVGTGSPLMVSPTTTITYSVKCKSGVCFSNAVNAPIVLVLGNPTGASISTGYVCAGQPLTLTATCDVGTPQWSATSGGTIIGTGSPFVVTPNPSTGGYNRYYVKCSNGTCTSTNNNISTGSYFFIMAPTAVASNQTTICQGSSVSLSATCGNGTVRWYDAETGGNLLGTGSPLSQTPTTTTTYYAECYYTTGTTCSTIRVATPQIVVGVPVTSPTNVGVDKTIACPSSNVTLTATCATGTVTWYSQPSGGTELGTGASFIHAPATTTTYYAECKSGACTPSSRVATSQVTVTNIGSNLNLTTNISGTAIHASSNTIVATNTIQAGANVKYLANNSITLNPQMSGGFQVANGAVFEAKIQPLSGCP